MLHEESMSAKRFLKIAKQKIKSNRKLKKKKIRKCLRKEALLRAAFQRVRSEQLILTQNEPINSGITPPRHRINDEHTAPSLVQQQFQNMNLGDSVSNTNSSVRQTSQTEYNILEEFEKFLELIGE